MHRSGSWWAGGQFLVSTYLQVLMATRGQMNETKEGMNEGVWMTIWALWTYKVLFLFTINISAKGVQVHGRRTQCMYSRDLFCINQYYYVYYSRYLITQWNSQTPWGAEWTIVCIESSQSMSTPAQLLGQTELSHWSAYRIIQLYILHTHSSTDI